MKREHALRLTSSILLSSCFVESPVFSSSPNYFQWLSLEPRSARGSEGELRGLLGGVAQRGRALGGHAADVPPRVVPAPPRATRALPGPGLRDQAARRRSAAKVTFLSIVIHNYVLLISRAPICPSRIRFDSQFTRYPGFGFHNVFFLPRWKSHIMFYPRYGLSLSYLRPEFFKMIFMAFISYYLLALKLSNLFWV